MFYNDTLSKVSKITGNITILISLIAGVVLTAAFKPLFLIVCFAGIAIGVLLLAISELLMRIDDLQLNHQEMWDIQRKNEIQLAEILEVLKGRKEEGEK